MCLYADDLAKRTHPDVIAREAKEAAERAANDHQAKAASFAMDAPTTRGNVARVLRALQLPKPVMLEGSPGVGKDFPGAPTPYPRYYAR